jgi:hypothetical protein
MLLAFHDAVVQDAFVYAYVKSAGLKVKKSGSNFLGV